MSLLSLSMDDKPQRREGQLEDWQSNAVETLARSLERTNQPAYNLQRAWPSVRKTTIRAITPENRHHGEKVSTSPISIEHTSPRSIPGGEKPQDRRKGLVFEDSYSSESLETKHHHGPPVSFHAPRPRTRTLDESQRHRSTSNTASKPPRQRIGSVHSTSASSYHNVEPRSAPESSLSHPSISTRPQNSLSKSSSVKGRKLTKRASRPTSPLQAMFDVPSVDSLPSPVVTSDANKILVLMKTLCGRMRGDVEVQSVESGVWYSGYCYIDDTKGMLMHEGEDRGPFHVAVISDLRGCRVRPVISQERQAKCLEITHKGQGIEICLLPLVKAEYDLWLAALLCWQQIRPTLLATSPTSPTERRPGSQRRNSGFNQLHSPNGSKGANIIKVAKLQLWDKGPPSSPRAIVHRTSTKNLKSPTKSSWRKVSCVLLDNGEFKLMTENDVTLLSIIQLSQLSRCAIQRLDRSVLGEEYCIAILPQYASTSTQLSIFRPVYIALESRLSFEVWFCLLRAFTIPEIYGPSMSNEDDDEQLPSDEPTNDDLFRIEKTLNLRIVEAKLRKNLLRPETSQGKAQTKEKETDLSVGDYFAEVMLDGELRAKTNTKIDTKNPFWREDYEFNDLPSYTPKVSIVLKRMEHLETSSHAFLSSSALNSQKLTSEIAYGTVDVPLDKLERGKDNETWWPIINDQEEQIGELFLKIRNDEIVVLLAKEYQEISELLHKFTNGLTIQIAQSAPSHLKPLAETLMNIFQVSGHATDWLTALVEDEIDGIGKENPSKRIRWSKRIGSNESFNSSSEREQNVRDMGKSLQGEANLLFRGNSLLTQALDSHMRRLGKEYLDEVLSQRVAEINALDSDCEVDPSRIAQGEDVNKNWTVLITLTTNVWKSISGSATRCPPELRHILKYVRAVAEDRYGDFLRTVAYTSVSGFLFLRFFCPALLNPKLFGLLRDHPRPKAQRALTLIAKSLQALANLSTFGSKEAWMEPMNRFLSSHRQGVKEYLDDICSIPAERGGTFALPASYSTPITILARLPPTSREGFPSLPYLIDHPRNFATLIKVWLEATSHYVAHPDMDGDILAFNQLCIKLQRRTDECLLKAEQADRTADQASPQYEDLVDSLESSTLLEPHTETVLQNEQWAESTTSLSGGHPHPRPTVRSQSYSNPSHHKRESPGSAGSEGHSNTPGTSGSIKDKKDRQSFWESTFGKDSKYQRPYEPLDGSQASSPPGARGVSRNGKASRSFLSGLRRKGTKEGKGDGSPIESNANSGGSLGTSWNSNVG